MILGFCLFLYILADSEKNLRTDLHQIYAVRLAPSLCISYSTKSDIHGIIMNPQMGGDITVRDEILLSAPHSGKKAIQCPYNTLDKRT